MIFRKNSINKEAAEVSMTLSFSMADIWRWLNRLCWLYWRGIDMNIPTALETTISKEDLLHWLTTEPSVLGWMPPKYATPIAEWAICNAVGQKYLIHTTGGYKMTASVAKRNGRPPEHD